MNDESVIVDLFRAIYDAHYDDLWRYCLRRTSSPADAEEVLADVFTVAWRRFDELVDSEHARPWLFVVARNHLLNRSRQSRRSDALHLRLVSDATVQAASAPHPEPPSHHDSASDVLTALALLNEPDAEILRLAVWEELSHREIAAVMDCSENAVAIRLHRARQRLADHLVVADRNSSRQSPFEPPLSKGDSNV